MGQRMRVLGTVALVAAGTAGLSGCGLAFSERFEDDPVVTEEITEVRIDNDNGDITVTGDAATTEVALHREVEYRGERPEEPSHRVEGGVLVLGECPIAGCSVRYELELPAGVPVTGKTDNGEIRLSGVGEVDVRSDNGGITVDGAAGPVTIRTSNGEIDLTLDTPQDIRAETDNGEITATVAAGTYQVSAQTDNGDLDIGIPDDPDGEHRIELVTDNGSVTVRSA